nr:venom protein [Lampona murina]
MILTQLFRLFAWIVVLVMILEEYSVLGFYRSVCYKNEQINCNEEFVDVYKHLSRSVHNHTVADTYFWLFTKKNPDQPECLQKCGGNLPPDTNFDAKNELIIIITPYIAGFCDFAVYREWLLQIFEKGEYNVLVVDWSWGSKAPYTTAIANSKIAAKQTVIVLKNIQEKTGLTNDKISIVGHSLAAHIAGFVGQDFPVARITGLDPAGPGFTNDEPLDERLDPTDADFVDVWHCNAGDCLPYLGINYDAGDVDFWINGGSEQSSCRDTLLPSFLRGDFIYAFENLMSKGCSHVHCSQYYKLSINPGQCQFVGVKCDNYEKFKKGKCRYCGENGENCMIMGFDTLKTLKGERDYSERFYVKTADTCPYCNNSDIFLQGFEKTYESSLQSKQ